MSKDALGTEQINQSGAETWSTYTSFTNLAAASTLVSAVTNRRICVTDINIEPITVTSYTFLKDVGGAASATCFSMRPAFRQSFFISLRNPIVLATNTSLGLTTNASLAAVFVSGYYE